VVGFVLFAARPCFRLCLFHSLPFCWWGLKFQKYLQWVRVMHPNSTHWTLEFPATVFVFKSRKRNRYEQDPNILAFWPNDSQKLTMRGIFSDIVVCFSVLFSLPDASTAKSPKPLFGLELLTHLGYHLWR
jgi:hypothetical protein